MLRRGPRRPHTKACRERLGAAMVKDLEDRIAAAENEERALGTEEEVEGGPAGEEEEQESQEDLRQ